MCWWYEKALILELGPDFLDRKVADIHFGADSRDFDTGRLMRIDLNNRRLS